MLRLTFPGVTLGLPVERLVLAKFLEGDHWQQAGSRPATRDDVKRRWGLADALAVAAGELLAHVLDHLPAPRNDFQRFGHILAELRQTCAATARAVRRHRHDHPLARQVVGKRLARRALAGERANTRGLRGVLFGAQFVLGRRGLQLFKLQFHLIEQAAATLRTLAEKRASEFLNLQLEVRDQRLGIGALGTRRGGIGTGGKKRRLERLDVVRQCRGALRDLIESQKP